MEYLFYYIPQAPNNNWVNVNKAHIPVTTQLSFEKQIFQPEQLV